jgi:hypothetical protein
VDISVAVAIDGGLITPIIANANQKRLTEVAKEMKELAALAKEGKLMPNQYQGKRQEGGGEGGGRDEGGGRGRRREEERIEEGGEESDGATPRKSYGGC